MEIGVFDGVNQGDGENARAAVNEAAATLRTNGSSGDITVTTAVLADSATPVILADAEASRRIGYLSAHTATAGSSSSCLALFHRRWLLAQAARSRL
jgi:hypothetical protein